MLDAIFQMGYRLQYVKRAAMNNLPIFEENYIYDNFINFEEKCHKIGINHDIQNIIDQCKEFMEKFRDTENQKLDSTYKKYFLENIEALQGLVTSELNDMLIFEAVKECSLDKNCLIKLSKKEEQAFFDKAVWDNLSDIAINDHSDAAKCILIGASTQQP